MLGYPTVSSAFTIVLSTDCQITTPGTQGKPSSFRASAAQEIADSAHKMASANPFDLLGGDDNENDPEVIAAAQPAVAKAAAPLAKTAVANKGEL